MSDPEWMVDEDKEIMAASKKHLEKENIRVWIWYTNHRGQDGSRLITPLRIVFASNEWYSEQWILQAYDHKKQAERSFAMVNIYRWEVL